MKFFLGLINLIFWIWLFLIPTGIMGYIAYTKYNNNHEQILAPLLILLFGLTSGIFIAEFVRRKYGLAYFFSRINASPDLDKLSTPDGKDESENKMD